MSTRRTIGAVLAIAAVGLVAVWLYAIAGSTGRLRALNFPAEAGCGSVSSDQPPRVVNRRPPARVAKAPTAPLILQESADRPVAVEGVETEDSFGPQKTGPISGAAFSELLESGLLGDELGRNLTRLRPRRCAAPCSTPRPAQSPSS